MTTSSTNYLTQVHQLLNEYFNLAEIQDLCFQLHIDYESVPGDEKPLRIRALLLGLTRQRRLLDLIVIAQQLRPRIDWPTIPDDYQLPESLPLEPTVPNSQYHIYGDFVQGDKIVGDKVMGDKHEHHHHHYPPEKKPPPPPRMALAPPDDFVQRPQEYEQLITYLLADNRQAVAITATLQGAGGFGKTTLAQAICHDERILEAFPDGILWTTIGDDRTNVIRGLQKLYKALTGEDTQFVDEHDATVHLSTELNERRCLLVIDDVWNGVHLRPFLQGAEQCARLITTRIASVMPKETELVAVDAMRQMEAVALLSSGLDAPDKAQLAALAGRLGEWALLLKLVNRRLYEDVKRHGVALSEAIIVVNEELDEFGLTSFDADNAEERDQAVAASMSVSLRQLRPDAKYGRIQVDEAASFQELAIFPEDLVIPVSVVALLWEETGHLSTKATERLCRRLADLSLLLVYDQQTQTIRLHDVTRHYLIEEATNEQYQAWQETLLNGYETKCEGEWGRLPDDGYTYQNLLWHMREAGQQGKLEQLLFSYDWLDAKLQVTDALNLINDFELRQDTNRHSQLGLLQHALQTSASVLVQDKNQLASQLYGRLSGLGKTWQPFVDTIQQHERVYWLQAQAPNLSPPGGNLIYILSGHTDGVNNLLLTDDGHLLSSSYDHTVKVWDIETGSLLHSLKGHTDRINNLLLTRDGKAISSSWDHTVKVWDIKRGTLLHSLEGHITRVDNLLLTGDGRLLTSCSTRRSHHHRDDRTVKVWDIERGTLLHSLKGHSVGVSNLLLTGDGRLLTSCSSCYECDDHTVKVWDIERGILLHSLKGHTAGVDNLLLTGDGRLLSSCNHGFEGNDDHTLKVWDIERGILLHSLEGHTAGVDSLILTGDGRLLSPYRNTVKVWDIERGILLHSLEDHIAWVSNLLLTGDGRLLSSCNSHDHTVKVWDIERGILLHSLEGHIAGVSNLLLTGDGHLLSSCNSHDHTVKVWDIERGILLHSLEGHIAEVSNLLLTGDGRLLTSCSSYHSRDHTVKVWDIERGILLHNLKGHTAGVDNLLLADDRRLLSSCSDGKSKFYSYDRTIRVWDIKKDVLFHRLEGHTTGVDNLLLTNNCRLVSSCNSVSSDDHTVKVWDIERGALLHTLKGHTAGVDNLILTDDGRLLSSCNSHDHTIKVWDIERGALLHSLESHTEKVSNLILTDDGRLVSSYSKGYVTPDRTVKVWDIEQGTLLYNFEGDTYGVDNLLLAGDGRLITSDNDTVKVWDIESGTLLHILKSHTEKVSNLILTNDGHLLHSCSRFSSDNYTVKVWNIETGTLLYSLEGHTQMVDNLLLTGNGHLISSCSKDYNLPDTTVKVWDIRRGTLLHSLEDHTSGVDNLLLTGNGHLISSCSSSRSEDYFYHDYTVKVWDIERGTLLYSLEGHTSGIDNLLLTGDGRLLSSCSGQHSHDHTVKVWDIERGILLHSLEGHISNIQFMNYLPKSNYLITIEETRLIIWKIDEGKQVAGFTTDGRITSYTIMPDDTIILGDGLGRVHFLKLVKPR